MCESGDSEIKNHALKNEKKCTPAQSRSPRQQPFSANNPGIRIQKPANQVESDL